MEPGIEYSSAQPQQVYHPPSSSHESHPGQPEQKIRQPENTAPETDKVTLLVFSGELDRVLAGLTIAATAASLGMDVMVFFTFWGINVLKEKRSYSGKDIKERMIDILTPAGPGSMGVSRVNMLGAGRTMLKQMMKEKDIVSAEELLEIARESGVRLVACRVTMQVMGIRGDELTQDIEVAGAASYLVDASRSDWMLYI
jgi:peroxiredoxin family protein